MTMQYVEVLRGQRGPKSPSDPRGGKQLILSIVQHFEFLVEGRNKIILVKETLQDSESRNCLEAEQCLCAFAQPLCLIWSGNYVHVYPIKKSQIKKVV